MKLRLIGFCILWISILLGFSACDETIDADKYNKVSPELLPVLSASNDSISFDRVKLLADITLKGDEKILESGFFVCEDKTFPDSLNRTITAVEEDLAFNYWVDKLVGSTEYFYKAYTYSANGFAFSEVNSFITDEPPVFEDTYLFGSFNQVDNSIFNGQVDYEEEGYWDRYGYIKITQVENTYNQVEIYNFWAYGHTIIGVVDFEKKEIAISPQMIYEFKDDTNEPIFIHKWGVLDGGYVVYSEDDVIATYDEDGTIIVKMWGAFNKVNGLYNPFEACTETKLIKKDL